MQAVKCNTPLWERSILQETAGTTLRPGGFALTDRGISLARISAKSRVLDAGCGLGATVEHLITNHSLNACGVDNSVRQIAKAPDHLPLTVAEVGNLPYPDAFFDALICECVLSLTSHPGSTVAEFKRILKPSGKLIISDLYLRTPHAKTTLTGSCASSPLDLRELEKDLKQSKMKVTTLEDHSKLLAELAAKLIFAGEQDSRLTGNCCSRPGYMLLIAKLDN